MSNRFHNKWHRKNHHTYGSSTNPDASHDPIASPAQPFLGDFSLQGALCAVAPLSGYAGYFYTNNTALSVYGGQAGINVYSPQAALIVNSPLTGINAYGGNVAGIFNSPTISLSTGGGGSNVFNSRVGIFKVPSTSYPYAPEKNVVLDVKGDTFLDGGLTITGDLSAFGYITYLDTIVNISSSVVVRNIGTGPALSVTQTGDNSIAAFYDDAGIAFYVDGHNSRPGYVGVGTITPNVPLTVVGDISSNGSITANILSARYINMVHTNPNDGINPIFFIGEQGDGSAGTINGFLSGFQVIYDEAANKLYFTTRFGDQSQVTPITIDSSANLGVNTKSPAVKLDISNSSSTPQSPSAATGTVVHITQAEGTPSRVLLDSFGSSSRSSFTGRYAAGTVSTPTATTAGNVLCEITGQGYGSSGYTSTSLGRMTINASETWSDSAQGTYLTFQTAANGTNTASERVRVANTGNVGINVGSTSGGNATAKLEVLADSNSSNIALSAYGSTNAAILLGPTNINSTGSNQLVNINTVASGNAATNIHSGTNTSALTLGNTSGATNINGSTIANNGNSTFNGTVSSNNFIYTTTGFGYPTGYGSGGTVTQTSLRNAGVTLNKPTGTITLVASGGTLGSGPAVYANNLTSFTFTNSYIGANDIVLLNQSGGSSTYFGQYTYMVTPAAGSATIYVRANANITSSDSPVLQFAVIKSSVT